MAQAEPRQPFRVQFSKACANCDIALLLSDLHLWRAMLSLGAASHHADTLISAGKTSGYNVLILWGNRMSADYDVATVQLRSRVTL